MLFAGTMWLGRHLVVQSWLKLVGYGAASALAIGVVAAFVGLDRPQRRVLLVRLRKILRGRGGASVPPAEVNA
jgi:hypothetical protein